MQLNQRAAALKIPPFLRLGFRPFFLSGAILALISIPLWIAGLFGKLGGFSPQGGWLAWHMHEMAFAFAGVIIAGFLLTAVQTWTGVKSISGNRLLALFLVWLAARILWFTPLPTIYLVVVDALFLPLVALQMAYCVGKAKQARNYPIVIVLLVLAGLNILSLMGVLNQQYQLQHQAALGAIWAVAAMMSIIGSRVIPFFTFRGLQLDSQAPAIPWLDHSLLFGSLFVAVSYGFAWANQASVFYAVIFIALGLGHAYRFIRWYDHKIWRVPLLWSLFLAYAWFVIAYLAMGAWHLKLFSQSSLALHALTVGAMSGLIIAMVSRVTLGHTGRPLVPPKAMTLAFAAINIAALGRVVGVQFHYSHSLWFASALWTFSFALFIYYYGPMLVKARIDGNPG